MNKNVIILIDVLKSGLFTSYYSPDENSYYIYPITKITIEDEIVKSFEIHYFDLRIKFQKSFKHKEQIEIRITSDESNNLMFLYNESKSVYNVIKINALRFLSTKNIKISQKYLSIKSELQEYSKNKELDIIGIYIDSANMIEIDYYLPNFENNVLEVKKLKVSIEEDPYLYYQFIKTLFNY